MTGRTGVFIWTAGLVAFAAVTLYRYDPTLFSRAIDQCPLVKPWIRGALALLGYDGDGNDVGKKPGTPTASMRPGERLMTGRELADYDGSPGSKGLLIAILGKIYDVQRGARHYGPDGPYHHFAGRDATRSFITGEDAPDKLTDDINGLRPDEIVQIDSWMKFYESDYVYIGRLIGRYYDINGNPTKALEDVQNVILESHRKRQQEEEERVRFPGCNSEWTEGKGGRVWCTNRSGGVERSWIGVPRQFYYPGTGETRCVCVHPAEMGNPNLREFPDCPSTEPSCPLPENKS